MARYDVFLSFRGEDTRKSFTDHLYTALVRQGIYTFRDDEELEKGQPIPSKLLQAIQDSGIALVVFSRTYAYSSWCLDELAKIVECKTDIGQKVYPIFYDVDPSEVRKQTGSFGQAFDAHEQSLRDGLEKLQQDRCRTHFLLGPKDEELNDALEEHFKGLEKVQKWRDALTEVANLSGFHLHDRQESEFIEEIIEAICAELFPRLSPISEDLGLVGMGSRLEEIRELCSGTEKNSDVHFIGISGMGGIGKTTLARVFYDEVCNEFQAKSFLENVREVSKRDGIAVLQKNLLSDLQMKSDAKNKDVHRGSSEIKHRLRHKKVLIILDDVDELKQLEALAGSHNWFGPGSRIIITTRDEQLLISHGVVRIYRAKELKYYEALQLFNRKAFKNNDDSQKDYMKLSHDFVTYAKGLPLAIEVLGPSLCGKSISEWESAFKRLKNSLDGKIMSPLLMGFDGLHEEEKEVFLDIACFFKGHNKDHVSEILESLGFNPIIGIRNLKDKCLITEVGSKLWMHDLLQEMGWEIVRRECPDEPGNRSRLWHSDDVLDVMTNDKGTDAVRGMVLSLPQEELDSDAFLKMKKLRFLNISDVLLPKSLNYLSTDLVVIEWHGYPSELLPENFPSKKLVQLNMCGSHIRHLWKGRKVLNKLKSIELNDSESLIETPDFTEVPNLERLILEGCTKLSKVHPSIRILKRLILLNMKNCTSLEMLPRDISLESLEIFNLSGCARLKKFPKIVGDMECLSKLYLDGTAIESLPVSIKRLTGITLLDLTGCKTLLRLPSDAISSLRKLKKITLVGCSNLSKIPGNLGCLEDLEELDISGTAIHQMPLSIVNHKNLKVLSCSNCQGQLSKSLLLSSFSSLTQLKISYCNLFDGDTPNDLDHLSSLKTLYLSGNNFTNLPESTCRLSKLEHLHLTNCSQLQSLPKLPFSIRFVSAVNCMSLKSDSDQYEVWPMENGLLGLVKRSISPRFYIKISRSQVVAWLQRYHEVESTSQPLRMAYGLSTSPSEISGWFNNQNGSDFVTISLDNENVSWIGCALAVGLVVHEDFDFCHDLKVKHVFDCYFHTDGDKRTLVHEIIVKDVPPYTGPMMYWVCIPYLWFSEQCNAFNECTSITASTIIDSPSVNLEMSGNRLLYNPQDFIEFSRAITSHGWVTRIRKNEKNNCGQLIKMARTEQERQVPSLKEQIESLSSDLECTQGRRFWGGNRHFIEGKLEHPRTATLLGEILQEYSIQNHLQYSGTFPQFEIPEWFYSVNGSSATIPLYPSFDTMKSWKGIAVCSAFRVDRHPSLILENLDPENCLVKCNLENFLSSISLVVSIREILSSLKGSGFIWISYASSGSFRKDDPLNEWTSMDLKFYCDNEDVTVHSCGYQVLFDQNMEELIETIVQCSTASEYQLSNDDDDDVNEDDKDDDDNDDDDDNVDDVNTPCLYNVIQALVSKLAWPLKVIYFQFRSCFTPT